LIFKSRSASTRIRIEPPHWPLAVSFRSGDSANDFKMLLKSLVAEDDLEAIEGEGPAVPFGGSPLVTDERVLPVIAMGKGSLVEFFRRCAD